MNPQPRFIGSASPFEQWAEKYFDGGFAPIPMPPNKKNPPPTGWTGHARPITDRKQLDKWLAGQDLNPKLFRNGIKKANIALRLNTIEVDGKKWDLVGIDVDHHPEDKDDPKNGGEQLEYFEKKLGKLPETWTSSARSNGISGIKLYRAPAGYAYRGDMGRGGEDIDIISKNYRFMVCFPSTNPDAQDAQYWWYPPGFEPDGDLDAIDRHVFGLVPDPRKLPVLPDKWIDFLTQNRIKDLDVAIDMDSSNKQLQRWAVKNFAPNNVLCEMMQIEVDKYKKKIDESAKSHNILTAMHNKLLRCGANEGHTGWGKAVGELEKYWVADVLARSKRSVTAAQREVERSRFGALRRIKGEADVEMKAGRGYFESVDACDRVANAAGRIKDSDLPPPESRWPSTTSGNKGPGDYDLNDDGNGLHFLDIHDGLVRYVANVHQKWMIWDGERWHVDEKETIARYLYRRVKNRQMILAATLWADYVASQGTTGAPQKKALALKWAQHAKSSGNVRDIDRALQAARAVREGISIKYEDLDKDRRALGCANGVVRVDESGNISVVENSKDMMITKNTGIEYIPLAKQSGELGSGKQRFKEFLDKFVAPSIDLDYFQKLCGSMILGDNREKMAVFFWGITDTAKSTMLELMIKSLGDYAGTRQPDFFRSIHLNPQLAQALSLRLVGVSELGDNQINSELFKHLTGGERITVELKGSNNLVSSDAQFTLVITTNGVPNVPGEDTAFRNRLRVIEFKHQASEADKLSGNQAKMYEQSKQACLAWLIDGASRYVKEGLLPIPVEIQMATEVFSSKLSDISEFVEENLIKVDGEFVSNADVFMRFKQWADRNNFNQKGWSQRKLTSRLKNLGFADAQKRIDDGTGKTHPVRGLVDAALIDNTIQTTKL